MIASKTEIGKRFALAKTRSIRPDRIVIKNTVLETETSNGARGQGLYCVQYTLKVVGFAATVTVSRTWSMYSLHEQKPRNNHTLFVIFFVFIVHAKF